MTKASDNIFPKVTLVEGSAPSSPSASDFHLYFDSADHLLKWKNSAGTVFPVTTGGLTDPMTTRGDTMVRNSSNVTARLAVGAANRAVISDGTDPSWGQILPATLDVSADNTTADATTGHHGLLPKLGGGTTNFLRADGTWNAPAGGGAGALVFLEAHTASASASLDFTTFISGTYDKYLIVGEQVALATNTANLLVEIGTGGGPTYDTSTANYEHGLWAINTNGTGVSDAASGTALARLFKSSSNNAGYGFGSFHLLATGLQSTAHRKTLHGTLQYVDSSPASIIGSWGMQWTTTATAATALRFIASSGNIASGSITIYGVTNS